MKLVKHQFNSIQFNSLRIQLEKQIEFQNEYFADLHEQLAQLYRRLNKDPIKDYCLAFKNGKDSLNAFVIKQVNK